MASNGTATLSPAINGFGNSSSQLISSSISSLTSSSSRHGPSQISKTYRQSSTLFLTRRLPESLSTILPVITPASADDSNASGEPAPISKASRTTRVKVWSLYLTILNAIVELDPDEGKQAFGGHEWRALVTKVRDGEVWGEVIENGYNGIEGDVDSDVVINLATLLLAHARTQKVNQQRLENYLASSVSPNLDLVNHVSSRGSRPSSRRGNPSGTGTPRDLNSRVKILELYTLHVLLRNNEWDYAREFITISEVLDEERREAFLLALQSLQDEQHEAEAREREERRYQEEELQKDLETARRRRAENEQKERRRQEEEQQNQQQQYQSKKSSSEVDYGIEEIHPNGGSAKARSVRGGGSTKGDSSLPQRRAPFTAPSSPEARHAAPSKKVIVPPSLATRASHLFTNIRKIIEDVVSNGFGFKTNPMILMRTAAFIIGLLVILSRKDVKERLKRALSKSWAKVAATAGMGVKVSYI